MTTPKRVRIRPKYSATVSFSWQEDKDGTNKQTRLRDYDSKTEKITSVSSDEPP